MRACQERVVLHSDSFAQMPPGGESASPQDLYVRLGANRPCLIRPTHINAFGKCTGAEGSLPTRDRAG